MTFPLTKTGRENLEAILAEFERAGRHYPPLYHERLVAWSESGEVRLSDAQWQAFIDAESNDQGESEWSEWDGPHPPYPGFSGTYLGRWYGDPDGMPEFFNLLESLTTVLEREDFSSVDDILVPIKFRSWSHWISTLHIWAFRFQMPLLSCEMYPWGAEDANPADFYELTEQLSQTGDVSWRTHPACWSLTYNVFTSSAAAIRAILRPTTVITTNEPWPYTISVNNDKPGIVPHPNDNGGVISGPCHQLEQGAYGWLVRLANFDRPIQTRFQTGLHRIAVLIKHSGVSFKAEDLYKCGRRKFSGGGRPVYNRKRVGDGDDLTELESTKLREKDIDEMGCADIEERLPQLAVELENATIANDEKRFAELQEEFEFIRKTHYIKDGKVIPKAFRDLKAKRDYDSVCRTIQSAIADLKQQLGSNDGAIKELEGQLVFPDLKFEPKEHCTPWRVVDFPGE